MPRALIWGYYGHYNLGDEAMLAGMLASLNYWCPELNVSIYSNHPTDTQQRHGVSTLCASPPRRRLEAWKQQFDIYKQMALSQYFVLGGGDLLRDGPDYSVAQIWLKPLRQAILLGCKSIIWGVSVGDIWRPETKRLIFQVLNKTDLITVRDRLSQEKLLSLGISKPVKIIPDLALAIKEPIALNCSKTTKQLVQRIGIAYRGLTQRNRAIGDREFEQAMANTIDSLVEQGIEVHILPFQSFPSDYRKRHQPAVDDYISALEMLKYSRHSEKVTLQPYIASLDELQLLLQTLDLLIGIRLHSLILAAQLGIPMIAVAYDPKVTQFMKEIQQEEFVISLESFNSTSLAKMLSLIQTKKLEIQTNLKNGLQHYQLAGASGLESVQRFWQPTA